MGSQSITRSGDSTVLHSQCRGLRARLGSTRERRPGCALPRAGVSPPVRDLPSLLEILRGVSSSSWAGGRLPSSFVAGRKRSVLCCDPGLSLSRACPGTAELLGFAGWFRCSTHTTEKVSLKPMISVKEKTPFSILSPSPNISSAVFGQCLCSN